jgi:glycosyltransferase involved in cell wall biosynthesis
LKILKDKDFPFIHTLIGDGDDRGKILQLIADLGLNDCCHWLGTRTHNEVLNQFENSDLFVLACEIADNGDRDGIPNVLVESLAMGVPALSTTVSAVPEILIHGKSGITVAPGEAETMAGDIETLLLNKELRTNIIQGGLEHTGKDFDNRSLVAKLGKIFEKHMGKATYAAV